MNVPPPPTHIREYRRENINGNRGEKWKLCVHLHLGTTRDKLVFNFTVETILAHNHFEELFEEWSRGILLAFIILVFRCNFAFRFETHGDKFRNADGTVPSLSEAAEFQMGKIVYESIQVRIEDVPFYLPRNGNSRLKSKFTVTDLEDKFTVEFGNPGEPDIAFKKVCVDFEVGGFTQRWNERRKELHRCEIKWIVRKNNIFPEESNVFHGFSFRQTLFEFLYDSS